MDIGHDDAGQKQQQEASCNWHNSPIGVVNKSCYTGKQEMAAIRLHYRLAYLTYQTDLKQVDARLMLDHGSSCGTTAPFMFTAGERRHEVLHILFMSCSNTLCNIYRGR